MNQTNNLYMDDTIICVQNKKIKIREFIHCNGYFTLKYNSHALCPYEDISIVLKNVKTREEFICPYKIQDDCIIINLDTLAHLFTDYEGAIVISVINKCKIYSYSPIVSKAAFLEKKCTPIKESKYQWYVRLLENGEIRLSSIRLKK